MTEVLELAEARLLRVWRAYQSQAETAGLIADFGHPNWPGWQWIIALLLLAQLLLAAQQVLGHDALEQLRVRRPGGPRIERVLRGSRGGREHELAVGPGVVNF